MILASTSNYFDRLRKRRKLCATLGIASLLTCAMVTAMAVAAAAL